MRPASSFRVAVLLAAGLPALTASAQPLPPTVHDPFTESGRYTVRGLRLGGQGNQVVAPGGRLPGERELAHNCPSCGGAVNQIIVGLAGEPRAQACIYNGGPMTPGWRSARFDLRVPSRPGLYEIRVRYAQAFDCRAALDWWRVDRPNGPTEEATIGTVEVMGSDEAGLRPSWVVLQDLDTRSAWIDQQLGRLPQYLNAPAGTPARAWLEQVAQDLKAQSRVVRQLERELRRSLRRERQGSWRPGSESMTTPPLPATTPPDYGPTTGPLAPPEVVVPTTTVTIAPPPATGPVVVLPVGTAQVTVPPPPPAPMQPHEFDGLLARLRGEGYDNSRAALLGDVLRSNVHFTTSQAVAVVRLFSFANTQVDAAAQLCPRIVEAGALVSLTSMLSFESSREELRRRTGGRCGL